MDALGWASMIEMAESIAPQTHLALISYQNAMSHLAENRLLEAMVEIRRSLASDPEFYDGQFLKARVHRLLGQYEEALPILENTLLSLCDDVDVLREAAEVTLLAGEDKLSIRFLQRLHDLDPTDEEVCSMLVAVVFHFAGARPALKKIKSCLKRNPEWAPGFLCLGDLLEYLGKPKQAGGAYGEALRLVPDHRGARKNLERLERGDPLEKGQYEKTYEQIFLAEAVRLSRDGLSTRSIRMLEKWKPKFRGHPEFLEIFAKTSFQLERYRYTLSAIQEIPIERRPSNIVLLEARSLVELRDFETAAARFGDLCRQRPDEREYWVEYLGALSKSGDGARAVRVVDEALGRHGADPELWFEAARIRKRFVNASSCTEALQKVVELQPDHPRALYALGVEKVLTGDAAGAVTPLSALTATEPEHLEAWRHLAIAYTKSRNWKNAHAAWSQVIRLSPTDLQAAGNIEKLNRLLGSATASARDTTPSVRDASPPARDASPPARDASPPARDGVELRPGTSGEPQTDAGTE